ncbi:hypothetical protein DPX16_7001 [Anabarilius grahami]|uniref:Secreted protein n=1 Tax=Anabarilius grahami TaxID=495550 RepID=A0A3N0Z4Y7_ANAGA|nr:hypothetical protein DPX16_7001 [Anabarilius grahami]
MLVLKMVLLLSCHGARLMANVDAISTNELAMTAKDRIRIQPECSVIQKICTIPLACRFFLSVLAEVH